MSVSSVADWVGAGLSLLIGSTGLFCATTIRSRIVKRLP